MDDLELRVCKLEELVSLLENKELSNNFFKEHKRLLNYEYSILLTKLKAEFLRYNPRDQLNLRKTILITLPEKTMHISTYLLVIKNTLGPEVNLGEVEIFLTKIKAVRNNQVCKSNIPEEEMRLYLNVL